MNIARIIRIAVAAAVFLGFIALFLGLRFMPDIAGLSILAKIQFAPAVASASIAIIALQIILALLFGRIYCSAICPLGIFQDCVSKLRPRKKHPYRHWHLGRAAIAAKYAVAVLWLASLIFGVGAIWSALDPYGIFGRFAAHLIAPTADWTVGSAGVAAAAPELLPAGLAIASIASAAVYAVIIAAFAFFSGRGYCSAVCPVGTILGIFGRFSLFGARIDSSKCRRCHACEKRCKMHCIGIPSAKAPQPGGAKPAIDASRCISCFNCLSSCKFGALSYGLRRKRKQNDELSAGDKPEIQTKNQKSDLRPNDLQCPENSGGAQTQSDDSARTSEKSEEQQTQSDDSAQTSEKSEEQQTQSGDSARTSEKSEEQQTQSDDSARASEQSPDEIADIGESRRKALRIALTSAVGLAAGALMRPASAAAQNKSDLADVSRKDLSPRQTPAFPPGKRDVRTFLRRCTGCGLCMRACPNRVIWFPTGAGAAMFKPQLRFDFGACRPSCNACASVCPTGALIPFEPAEKASNPVGIATFALDKCVNYTTKSTNCSACARMCPYGAISLTDAKRSNGKANKVPSVDPKKCVGCGTCEYVCAARPTAAIHVEGLDDINARQ